MLEFGVSIQKFYKGFHQAIYDISYELNSFSSGVFFSTNMTDQREGMNNQVPDLFVIVGEFQVNF